MKIRSVIVLTDIHVPYHDVKSLAAVEKYMAAHKWDAYINLGDFLDMDVISSFNADNPRALENRRISDDIEEANKILDRHQAIIHKRNPKAEFVLLEGNHEERVERFLDRNPTFIGTFDLPNMLRLKERGFKWVKAWSEGEAYTYGKATFLHGQYTNQYHSAKMVNNYGESVFYGHTHDVQNFPRPNKLNPSKVSVGQSLGCLCKLEQGYMRGKPHNWQQAFGVFFFKPNGTYTYYVPRIFSNSFIGPDGKLYD